MEPCLAQTFWLVLSNLAAVTENPNVVAQDPAGVSQPLRGVVFSSGPPPQHPLSCCFRSRRSPAPAERAGASSCRCSAACWGGPRSRGAAPPALQPRRRLAPRSHTDPAVTSPPSKPRPIPPLHARGLRAQRGAVGPLVAPEQPRKRDREVGRKQQRFWGAWETWWGARRLKTPPEEPMPSGAGVRKFIPRGVDGRIRVSRADEFLHPMDGTESMEKPSWWDAPSRHPATARG